MVQHDRIDLGPGLGALNQSTDLRIVALKRQIEVRQPFDGLRLRGEVRGLGQHFLCSGVDGFKIVFAGNAFAVDQVIDTHIGFS